MTTYFKYYTFVVSTMNTNTDPYKAHCLKCGYDWTKKTTKDPKVCPACNSRNWKGEDIKKHYEEDYKHNYYIIFDNKKVLLLDSVNQEQTTLDILNKVMYRGDFTVTASFMPVSTEEGLKLMLSEDKDRKVLSEYVKVHIREAKNIFEFLSEGITSKCEDIENE